MITHWNNNILIFESPFELQKRSWKWAKGKTHLNLHMLHISNTPAHENNVLIALLTKSKANAILSRVAISPEHLTARRQITLIVCASNPSLHL